MLQSRFSGDGGAFTSRAGAARALAWPGLTVPKLMFSLPHRTAGRPVSGFPVPCPYLKEIGLGVPAVTKPEGNEK